MVTARIVVFAVLLTASGCSYDARFHDCEVRCTDATGCPDDYSCGSESLCRLHGERQTCTEVLGDAGLPRDAPDVDTGTGIDAPFACTLHSQCSAMTVGTCCVSPGPSGHCEVGTVLGGGFCYVEPT